MWHMLQPLMTMLMTSSASNLMNWTTGWLAKVSVDLRSADKKRQRHLLLLFCVVFFCLICTVCRHHCQLCWEGWRCARDTRASEVHQHTLLRVIDCLNSLSMASGLRIHLHGHHLHDNRVKVLGKQAGNHGCNRQMTQKAGQHWANIGLHKAMMN